MSPSVRVPSHAVVTVRATDPSRSWPSARRRALALGVALVVGCVVAACSGSTEPDPTRSVETSAKPSPTETPEPSPTETGPVKPERPAAMDRDDAEGAAAAAEYYVSLYGYVLATGDTAEWAELSHADCGFCSETAQQARWLKDNGGTHTGGEMTLTVGNPSLYARDEATGIWPLDGEATQAPFLVSDSAGVEIASGDASRRDVRAEVGRHEGAWVIVEIAPVPES